MPPYNNGAGYFLYVGDISEVYNYNVPSGGTMFFMNKNEPVLYLKSVNMFNQQTVTEYSLIEKVTKPQTPMQPVQSFNEPTQNQNEYVTRSELQSLIADTIRDEMQKNRGYKKREDNR